MTAGEINLDQLHPGELNNNDEMCKSTEESAVAECARRSSKYSLRARSVKKRIETEARVSEPKVCTPRVKARPPPLSKYRRKTANARERDRMKDINQAFDVLERSLPQLAAPHKPTEKVTKITILRLAIKYIKTMQDLLDSENMALMNVDEHACPNSVGSATSAASSASPSSVLTDCSTSDLPDPLDNIEGLTDFQLPGGLDLLLDMKSDSVGLDFSCAEFSDLPSP